MPDSSVPITAGTGTNIDTFTAPGGDHRQLIIPSDHAGFGGRFTTQRTIGRAGTTGQNLASIWNAVGSGIVVQVNFVGYDVISTVIKAVTVAPAIVRVHKLTTQPTGGTAGYKVADDSGGPASSASVTTLQDAATDTTLSATALGFTQTTAASGLTQEYAPRLITAAGYEMADRLEFLQTSPVILRPGEGLGVRLDYTAATQNPATDIHIVAMMWEEYQP